MGGLLQGRLLICFGTTERCANLNVRMYTNQKMRCEKGGSQIQKHLEKSEKSSKKVLTFLWGRDNINKLAREAHAKSGQALNLENDTEQDKRKQETVIPNELNLVGETD